MWVKNISGKNKSLCVGDLIRFYGETRYKMIEGVERLNRDEKTKGMVANLLKKALNNPSVDLVFGNIEEISKRKFFNFTVNKKDPLEFDDGKDSCVIVIEMQQDYFAAKSVYSMMKPGIRKYDLEKYIEKEKKDWQKWFEKNLNGYTRCYTSNILEE